MPVAKVRQPVPDLAAGRVTGATVPASDLAAPAFRLASDLPHGLPRPRRGDLAATVRRDLPPDGDRFAGNAPQPPALASARAGRVRARPDLAAPPVAFLCAVCGDLAGQVRTVCRACACGDLPDRCAGQSATVPDLRQPFAPDGLRFG
jgi:hypothetical protein